jgi:16S rRNA processing protein RimM
MARPEWIEVGRISRAHGVHGELRVLPDSDNPDRFAPGSVLYGRPFREGKAGPRQRERLRLTIDGVRGDASFPIVAFAGVSDRAGAEALRGYLLEISSDELPELDGDQFYPFDLIGLEVRDGRGAEWGRVADVVETPAHPLLVVIPAPREAPGDSGGADAPGPPGEVFVPFVTEAVPIVSPEEGYVMVETRFLEQS